MGKTEILKILHNYKKEVADQSNIIDIGIFGSVARNEATEFSDVDIVVRISEPDLFMLAGIKYDLEERLGRPVDVVAYSNSMNPFLQKRIDSGAVYA